MKKTMLAASLTAALCLMISNSYAREISLSTSTELTDITKGDLIDDKGSTAYNASGNESISGINDNVDLSITGGWYRGFSAINSNSWNISNLNNFTIDFNNPELVGDSVGLYAGNGGSITLKNINNVYITGSQDKQNSGTDPIPIHANNGSVTMTEVGNVTIKALHYGNGIMVQGNNGSVNIDAEGDISIESDPAAILVGLIANTSETSASSLSLSGSTINIISHSKVGVEALDYDNRYDGPNPGKTNLQLIADEKISINAGDCGVLQARTIGSGAGSQMLIQAPVVEVNGEAGAIVTFQSQGTQVVNNIKIDAQRVNLVSGGKESTVVTNASFATLDVDDNAVIDFVNSASSERPQISITATEGNSIGVSDNAHLNFQNADVNVQQGNVEGTGTVALNGSTLNLAENVTMSMENVEGERAQIVFNTARENAVQIANTTKSVSVLASGDLNDRYGADALNFINADGATTGAQAGKVRGAIVELADGSHAVQENTAMKALEQMNASTLVQFRLENNRLSQRLGEVRDNLNKAGGWARVYGAKSRLSDSIDSTIKTNSIQVGADATVGSNWIVGGAFSYTNMDADFSNGNGDSESYMLSAYASGFFDCGGYIDVIGRVGRMSTDLYASSGVNVEAFDGSYDNTAFGLSTEVGYHWKLSDVFFVEPQAELAYGYVLGDDYTASNGVKVEQDDFQSLVGRLGTRLGAAFPKDAGIIYAHASVNHDFLGNNDFTAQAPGMTSALKFSNDLDETWISYGIGLQLNPSRNFYVYGSLDRASGSEYAESYHYSVGARYVF